MIFDAHAMFTMVLATGAKTQVITGTDEVIDSVNVMDLAGVAKDMGPGSYIEVFAQIMTLFTGLTGLTVNLVTDADVAFSNPTILQSVAMGAAAACTAGRRVTLSTLPEQCERYLKLTFTIAGTEAVGDIMAGLILDRQTNS